MGNIFYFYILIIETLKYKNNDREYEDRSRLICDKVPPPMRLYASYSNCRSIPTGLHGGVWRCGDSWWRGVGVRGVAGWRWRWRPSWADAQPAARCQAPATGRRRYRSPVN